MFFFFFSSRRRHTRLQGDWSSDVCSSDLRDQEVTVARRSPFRAPHCLKNSANVAAYGSRSMLLTLQPSGPKYSSACGTTDRQRSGSSRERTESLEGTNKQTRPA